MNKKKFIKGDCLSFCSEHFNSLDFSHADLSTIDLSDSVFQSCHFYNPTASEGCSFERCNLRNAIFIDCDLTLCRFEFSDLFGAEFRHCRLIGTNFETSHFADRLTDKSYLCSGKIEDSNLSNACLAGLILQHCSLTGNRWYETDVEKADFHGSDLSGGEFSGINWQAANFTGCNLRGGSLQGLDIRRTDLCGVILDPWQASELVSALGVTITTD